MRILHLSDVHFGRYKRKGEEGEAHFFLDGKKPVPLQLAEILNRDEECRAPDVAVLSGDLGETGAAADYELAFQFLDDLRTKWKQTIFVIAPGNHDVELLDDKLPVETRQDPFIDLLKRFYGDRFNVLYPLFARGKPEERRQNLISIEASRNDLVVVSINSAASLNTLSDPIFVKGDVLSRISDTLKEIDKDRNRLRIFVLHHHLLPFDDKIWTDNADASEVREKPDSSIVSNSARLQTWLADECFCVVLHGHRHQFHGREDVLWRMRENRNRTKVVIVGAGSAGVRSAERRDEPLSVNVIKVDRRNKNQWGLQILTGAISETGGFPKITEWLPYSTQIGEMSNSRPVFFEGETMADCHQGIKDDLAERRSPVRSFVSVVQRAEYIHCDTISIAGKTQPRDNVERSFTALHPEYDKDDSWNDYARIDRILRQIENAYRIQHGPRLFGKIARFSGASRGPEEDMLRPIRSALRAIESGLSTRAFVSLYDPDRDIEGNRDLLPGLIGIQFLPGVSRETLDIVMFFRNLELSFWWAVNMLEGIRLLEWACAVLGKDKHKPGTVTMMASTAEWRLEPRPMFVSDLDRMSRDELFALIIASYAGSADNVKILSDKLKEKAADTTDINIDSSGLEQMNPLVRGIVKLHGSAGTMGAAANGSPFDESFVACLDSAIERKAAARSAVSDRLKRDRELTLARKQLERAASILDRWLANASTGINPLT